MNPYVVIAGLILLVTQGGPIPQAGNADVILARWNDEINRKLVLGALWTATHSETDERSGKETLVASVAEYLEALDKGDRSVLQPEAITAFKKRLSSLLADEDHVLRALGAVLLGVCGDKSDAGQLARLLEPRSVEGLFPRLDRGRAATALGMIGAREYTLDLVTLLKSPIDFDRSGAALGLGMLRASQYEQAISNLLNDEDEGVRETAKISLALMRQKPR